MYTKLEIPHTAVCRIIKGLPFYSSKRPILGAIGLEWCHTHIRVALYRLILGPLKIGLTFYVEQLYHFGETKMYFVSFLSTLFSENQVGETFLFLQNGTVALQKR